MATAEELLAGELTDTGTWFEVDLLSRRITIPKEITNLGAKGDDDFMHARFKLPRFYYDIDFADFELGIDYTNAQGEEDRYEPKDVVVGDDVVTFTWVVGRHAALYDGIVTFGLCAKRLNPADPDDPFNEFHTTKASLPILDAMETCEETIIEHTDLLEQWRRDLFGIGDTEEQRIKDTSAAEQEAIANEGARVLATIPADYQTAVSMTDNADRTKADAIICSAQGETITVSDSSDDYLHGLKIFGKTTQITTTGKNLFQHTQSNDTVNGVNVTVNSDDSITMNGTCTSNSIISIGMISLTAGQSYILTGCPSGGSDTTYRMDLRTDDGETVVLLEYGDGATITVDTTTVASVCIRLQGGNTSISNKTFYPMIRLASVTDATYEPYTGGAASPNPDYPQELVPVENPTVDIHSKNLASNRIGDSVTYGGITIERKAGISEVTLNGVATKQFSYKILDERTLPAGVYTISVHGLNRHNSSNDRLYVYDTANSVGIVNYIQTGSPKTFELKVPTRFRVDGIFAAESSYDNQVIKIQIERGSSATTYEPAKTVQTLNIPRTLHGIPVSSGGNYTDSNGQQWVCDEIDFERGVYVQRVENVKITPSRVFKIDDLGKNTAQAVISGIYHKGSDSNELQLTLSEPILSNRYTFAKWSDNPWNVANSISYNSYAEVRVKVSATETVESYQQFVTTNDVYVTYIRKDPIETTLSAEELAAFQFTRTNFPNTTVINSAGAWMELKYNADTKTYLDNCARTLVDTVTGQSYKLNIVNGKLTLIELEV